jgi:hypothetical protein
LRRRITTVTMSKGKREEITRQRKIKMRRITTVRGKS